MKKLKIGICGWGTVATALYKCIEANSEYIQQKKITLAKFKNKSFNISLCNKIFTSKK